MEAQKEIIAVITSAVLTAAALFAIWLYRRYQSKKSTPEPERNKKTVRLNS